MVFSILCFSSSLFLLHTMDERRHKILVALCFYYGHALSDYTNGCIVVNNYWTTLEYDEYNVVFHGVC
jgi:hypothetical protein